MAEEQVLTINIGKSLLRTARWRRGKEAMRILRDILRKRTKAENIKIDKTLNERIWVRGMEKPVTKLRIRIIKVDDKSIRVEALE